MSYKRSIKAAEDIGNILLYILENWSMEQADRYVNLIFDEIEYLASNPESGKDISHIRLNYRYSRVKSHMIFYRTTAEMGEVEVIRVLHKRMDFKAHLFR